MMRLQLIWADQAYAREFVEWVWERFTWIVEIVKRPAKAIGFTILAHRWVVERTFGWLWKTIGGWLEIMNILQKAVKA